MKRTALLLSMLLASLHAPYALADETAMLDGRAAVRAFLRADENKEVVLRVGQRGVPAFLRAGEQPLARAQDSSKGAQIRAVMQFLRDNDEMFRLRQPWDELELASSFTDEQGRQHYRFRQLLNGVPVRGAELLAHFDEDALEVLNGSTEPTPGEVNTVPAISEAQAMAIAGEAFGGSDVEMDTPLLEIREIDAAERLVYDITSYENGLVRWKTVIDAETGEVILHDRDVRDATVSASGKDALGQTRSFTAWSEYSRFHMVDVTTPVLTGNEDPLRRRSDYGDTYVYDLLNTEGDSQELFRSNSRTSGWDSTAVSAMLNAQAAYRYFYDVHGRAGVDNRYNLLVGVHYGNNYDNAYWSGKWMVFGDGGSTFSNPAACADIVAHELTHGVVELTADLIYEKQSGALNESFADVFAVFAENRNWKIGEDCIKPYPGWLRNLADTSNALRWQPEHMDEFVELENTKDGDWGGVHVNSGIPNRAAWLLVEGLSAEGIGTSIGRQKAEKLYFRALSTYLTSSAEFIDLRRALLQSAQDLYAGDDVVASAVHAAFDAVGIVEGNVTPTESAGGALHFSASQLDFGDVTVGQRKTMTLRLQNTGAEPLALYSLELDGEAFSQNLSNTVLQPGEIVEAAVTVQPQAVGTIAGTLSIAHDGADSPALVELLATGVMPMTSLGSNPQPAPDPQPSEPKTSSGGGALLWIAPLLGMLSRRRSRAC